MMSLSTQLRKAIVDSELTLYRVAKETDLPYAVVHRFVSGKRGLSLASADKLAELFGMRLTRRKRVGRGK